MNGNEWLETGMLMTLKAIQDYIDKESESYQIAFCSDFLKWFNEHSTEYIDKIYDDLEEEEFEEEDGI